MITNPYSLVPFKSNAWAEGFTKGYVSIAAPEPSENVSSDDYDAFNEGVAAGLECATNGLSLDDPCVPALEEHGPLHVPGMIIDAAHIAHGVWELRHLATVAAGAASIFVAAIELAITLPVHILPAEQVLPTLGLPVTEKLAAYGLDSMQLFCGAGLDANAVDCEILLSPLYPTPEQAREAAIAMGRYQWLVVSWRTDQSNSFQVVDSG